MHASLSSRRAVGKVLLTSWFAISLLAEHPPRQDSRDGAAQSASDLAVDAKDDDRPDNSAATQPPATPYVRYRKGGWRLGNAGQGRFSARVNFRMQTRYATPARRTPRTSQQFSTPADGDLFVRRARFKASGTALGSWIRYGFEHDLIDNRNLDARITLAPRPWLQFRTGQWKVDYNREQIDSSGRQQFVERSIVNREFTLSRHKGLSIRGRLGEGSRGDSRYYVGFFTGNGAGWGRETRLQNPGGSPLVMARYQWNPLGREVPHAQSDTSRHERPAVSIAAGAARYRGRFTRFSSSGGSQLDGFDRGQPGQYEVEQALAEVAARYQGFSLQSEWHYKQINDQLRGGQTSVARGASLQAGYFLKGIWRRTPKQLELAGRYAFVDPSSKGSGDLRSEYTGALNWFFYGHDNKLTVDASLLRLGSDVRDTQVRCQWDVSF